MTVLTMLEVCEAVWYIKENYMEETLWLNILFFGN